MNITFKNIAGYDQEKKEVMTLCNMLNDYATYKNHGVALPKGILLYGKPGVGKTLFAKAIANEIKRTFIQVDFSNVEHGDYQTLIKKQFTLAKETAPAIIFIDEIDKLIPIERMGDSFYSDISRTTLQLLLSMLDGFKTNEEVMLICTTNTLWEMPTALTRAGRIDKHIELPLPDDGSREAIAKLYLAEVKYAQTIDMQQVVLSTEGLSGADIKTVINEAAINAISNELPSITTKLLIEHIYRVSGKSLIKQNTKKDEIIVAYHELGHLVVANSLKKIIKEVSINKSSSGLGVVKMKVESNIYTTNDILNEATIALGGRAAEIIFLKAKYTGSWLDIKIAKSFLRQAIGYGNFGFKYLNIADADGIEFSDSAYNRQKAIRLTKKCLKRAIKIVKANEALIMKLHPVLLEVKTLTASELTKYLNGTLVIEEPQNLTARSPEQLLLQQRNDY